MSYFDQKAQRCMRRLAIVPRWQTAPAHRRQSVLEHSVGVLMIAGALAEKLDVTFDFDDAMKCLQHDMDEAIHGDTPSTSKKRRKASDCTSVKYAIMKAADYLESLMWIKEEREMGNTRLQTPRRDTWDRAVEWLDRACELTDKNERANFLEWLVETYDPQFHPPMEYS